MKIVCLLLCLVPLSAQAESESERLNQWLDAEFIEYLDFYPQSKRRYGIADDYDKLNDASLAHRDKVLLWRKQSVSDMQANFDRSKLNEQAQISYDLWNYLLVRAEAAKPFWHHGYVFGRRGPHTSIPRNLITDHKVKTRAEMEAYIAKLRQVERAMGQNLARAQTAAEKDIRAPFFDYRTAITQSKQVIEGAPFTETGEAPLWADAKKKIAALQKSKAITKDEANELRQSARDALLGSVSPAYQALITWLEADIENTTAQAKGVWSLPEGEAYYQQRLNQNTTLTLSVDDIHEIGLAEVKRLQAEMRGIKDQVGFKGELAAFFKHLRESDEFYLPNTEEGRQQYLELARQYLAAVEKKLPEYFGVLPKMPLEVRRVEAFREQPGGSAHYSRGNPNGTRPGIFYVHLIDMRAAAVYRLENLAYHEGSPGHHMQIAIQQEIEGLPRFRNHHGYTAFSEGWGLYSEWLGKEMGFYSKPFNDLGRLSGELWRSIRLVVDTGIHSKGWSQAQATDYALRNSPYPVVKVKAEIRRYFNNPGQATAYKIGMMKIMQLRQMAEQSLGDQFDVRAFHDTVIGAGQMPLPVLQRRIEDWVASQRRSS